jgi:hypothetical protein
MVQQTRTAEFADLDEICELTADYRSRLAAWSPLWWSPSPDALGAHREWIGRLLNLPVPSIWALSSPDGVDGCFAASRQSTSWYVTDVGGRTADSIAAVIGALPSTLTAMPTRVCVARADTAQAAAATERGATVRATYWVRATPTHIRPAPHEVAGLRSAIPMHTFGGAFDVGLEGAVVVTAPDGSSMIGSPSLVAPPVYDLGGTACIAGLVEGTASRALVDAMLESAAARGDAVLNIVVPQGDARLGELVEEAGFTPIIDALEWAA